MAVYRMAQFVGTSFVNYNDATKRALAAAQRVTALSGVTDIAVDRYESEELRGEVRDGKMEFHAKINVYFVVEKDEPPPE